MVAANRMVAEDDGDSQEELELLWALWDAQQQSAQEAEDIRRATDAHREISHTSEMKQLKIRDVEAELKEAREQATLSFAAASGLGDVSRVQVDHHDLQLEIQDLEAASEAMQEALKEINLKLQDGQDRRQGKGWLIGPLSRTRSDTAAREAELLESELVALRRAETRAAEEHRRRLENLRQDLSEVEVKNKELRRSLREELVELCAEKELLKVELDGIVRARASTLDRLRTEESAVIVELQDLTNEQDMARQQQVEQKDGLAGNRSMSSRSSISTDGGSANEPHQDCPIPGSLMQGQSSLFQEVRDESAVRRRTLRQSRTRTSHASFRPLGSLRGSRARVSGIDVASVADKHLTVSDVAPFTGSASSPSAIGESDGKVCSGAGIALPHESTELPWNAPQDNMLPWSSQGGPDGIQVSPPGVCLIRAGAALDEAIRSCTEGTSDKTVWMPPLITAMQLLGERDAKVKGILDSSPIHFNGPADQIESISVEDLAELKHTIEREQGHCERELQRRTLERGFSFRDVRGKSMEELYALLPETRFANG